MDAEESTPAYKLRLVSKFFEDKYITTPELDKYWEFFLKKVSDWFFSYIDLKYLANRLLMRRGFRDKIIRFLTNKRFLIYGTGSHTKKLLNSFKSIFHLPGFVGLGDRSGENPHGFPFKVFKLEDIKHLQLDFVLISSEVDKIIESIRKDLIGIGLNQEKMVKLYDWNFLLNCGLDMDDLIDTSHISEVLRFISKVLGQKLKPVVYLTDIKPLFKNNFKCLGRDYFVVFAGVGSPGSVKIYDNYTEVAFPSLFDFMFFLREAKELINIFAFDLSIENIYRFLTFQLNLGSDILLPLLYDITPKVKGLSREEMSRYIENYDFYSLCEEFFWRNCKALITKDSPRGIIKAKKLFKVDFPSISLFPLPSALYWYGPNLRREIKMVFAGYLPDISFFDMMEFDRFLKNILKNENVFIDIYDTAYGDGKHHEYLRELSELSCNLRYLEPIEEKLLLRKLADYDIGIYWGGFDDNAFRKKSCIYAAGQKFFDYLGAGIPVLSSRITGYASELIRRFKLGLIAGRDDELRYLLIDFKSKFLELKRNVLGFRKFLEPEYLGAKLANFLEGLPQRS